MIKKVLNSIEYCFDEDEAEDDVLYGNAGYLYCLLCLKHYCNEFDD